MSTSLQPNLEKLAYQALEEHLARQTSLEINFEDNLQQDQDPIACHIIQISQDNFTITLNQEYDTTNLQDSQTLQFTTCGSDHQLRFNAKVLGKVDHPDYDNAYMLTKPTDVQGLGVSEQRLSFRFATTNLNLPPLKIVPAPPKPTDKEAQWENDHIISLRPIESEIQNASEGGLGVAVPIFIETTLAKTKRLKAKITLPQDNQEYQITARIAHYHFNASHHNYYLGLEITQDQQGKDFLNKLYQLHKQPLHT